MLSSPALFLVVAVFAFQEKASRGETINSSAEQRLRFAKQSAEAYQFRLTKPSQAAVALHADPLLRWNNQVVREDDGMLFLWTEGENGPPVAAAQFFLVASDWHHEFQSLSQSGFDVRCRGEGSGKWHWHPDRSGVEFTAADEADRPSQSAGQRLRQMKAIAERFTAAVDSTESVEFENPEQLRLLARPLYRYSAREDSILDGALFAFVQGTNPEVFLLIEAEETKAGSRWRYGFARMSCFQLRVERDGKPVYVADREPVPSPNFNAPYHLRWAAEPDRSANADVSPAQR